MVNNNPSPQLSADYTDYMDLEIIKIYLLATDQSSLKLRLTDSRRRAQTKPHIFLTRITRITQILNHEYLNLFRLDLQNISNPQKGLKIPSSAPRNFDNGY